MTHSVPTDRTVLDLLRRCERMTVSDFERALGVTATAVRQRLTRLLDRGLIERRVVTTGTGRGRPSHWYELTEEGRRSTGSNLADLALVMWEEIRAITNVEVRQGLLQRLAERLVAEYQGVVTGRDRVERMASLVRLFAERQVPFEVQKTAGGLPVLTALACPYPELAERDRSICAMERMMVSGLVGESMVLSQCRLDGASCCTFAPSG